ncbi:hypothetical protein [Sphingomonas desiccabilis]|uniref:Uncharacterized protein n=1 Tax=Sphingomonas desiccabilis TaxID=429134 RepID=A0A4Q2IQB9_9SPHN|nr:hypothetical protein [Sphingomonas desiccabilis]MBB3912086.1 hypothetical protein [Sphingomonas desiccabilis]RXZ30255.1 hypothetical protein EO081_13680 [Sphingomonas desiccabilis]
MSESLSRAARVRPWAALLLPPVAWYVFELGLGSVLKVDCAPVGAWLGIAWGLASLAVCGLAMAIAWPCARPAGDQTRPRAWLSRVALLLAGIFALAIAFQTLAVLIVPPCVG